MSSHTTAPGLSHALAEFACTTGYDDIPEAVRARARIHMLDGLGIALASQAFPFAAPMLAAMDELGATGPATIIGTARKAAPRDAALANGVLIHGLDFDDTHMEAILHPTAAVLPAVLAVAEQRGASGRAALVAYCLGMEVAIRLGAAAKGGFQRRGFHATGVLGHFSAALAAGRLMGAGVGDQLNALGMAASTASGVQVYLEDGAWTKRLHPGWAASTGITCATFGRHGFVGPARPLEGRFGIFDTHLPDAGTVALEEITEGLGRHWKLADTALKPYPVCHYIHGAAEAAIGLQAEIGRANIDAVEILLPDETMQVVAEPIDQKRQARSAYEAQFSAPYVVAAALLKGRFGLAELSEAALADAEVQALAARCTCVTDPHSRFPDYYSGGLRLVLADGRRLEAHVPINNGAGPRKLSLKAARTKFLANAGLTLPAARAEAVAQAVAGLENAPVSALMETLATPA